MFYNLKLCYRSRSCKFPFLNSFQRSLSDSVQYYSNHCLKIKLVALVISMLFLISNKIGDNLFYIETFLIIDIRQLYFLLFDNTKLVYK